MANQSTILADTTVGYNLNNAYKSTSNSTGVDYIASNYFVEYYDADHMHFQLTDGNITPTFIGKSFTDGYKVTSTYLDESSRFYKLKNTELSFDDNYYIYSRLMYGPEGLQAYYGKGANSKIENNESMFNKLKGYFGTKFIVQGQWGFHDAYDAYTISAIGELVYQGYQGAADAIKGNWDLDTWGGTGSNWSDYIDQVQGAYNSTTNWSVPLELYDRIWAIRLSFGVCFIGFDKNGQFHIWKEERAKRAEIPWSDNQLTTTTEISYQVDAGIFGDYLGFSFATTVPEGISFIQYGADTFSRNSDKTFNEIISGAPSDPEIGDTYQTTGSYDLGSIGSAPTWAVGTISWTLNGTFGAIDPSYWRWIITLSLTSGHRGVSIVGQSETQVYHIPQITSTWYSNDVAGAQRIIATDTNQSY